MSREKQTQRWQMFFWGCPAEAIQSGRKNVSIVAWFCPGICSVVTF